MKKAGLIRPCPTFSELMITLRLQIQKNLYRPDPDEIADRMIEESLQEILWLRQNLN
jgi:hypothetical protein